MTKEEILEMASDFEDEEKGAWRQFKAYNFLRVA